MDCFVSQILESWWRGIAWQLRDNVIQSENKISEKISSPGHKVRIHQFFFFYSNTVYLQVCVAYMYHYILILVDSGDSNLIITQF